MVGLWLWYANTLAYHNQEKMKQNGFEKITRPVKKEEKDVTERVSGPATFRVLSGRDNHYTTETTEVRISLLPSRLSNHFTSLSKLSISWKWST